MWEWGRGDSSLWNQGGHLGDTLTEMASLSGHTATGTLPSCKRQPALPGETRGPPHTRWYSRPIRPFFRWFADLCFDDDDDDDWGLRAPQR